MQRASRFDTSRRTGVAFGTLGLIRMTPVRYLCDVCATPAVTPVTRRPATRAGLQHNVRKA
ncbi:hypothetical protein BN2475_730018 [Paraburkholderia ribeironis]|uniref:Uncharacterized protein n=1 Tax=Paraburkholderia ribeironis TaxID=1247936 RepID=A0A1N7SJE1_9BURK|nr:hypothetical protein BN2475_730018 [Paraburkholderia ribeironis]